MAKIRGRKTGAAKAKATPAPAAKAGGKRRPSGQKKTAPQKAPSKASKRRSRAAQRAERHGVTPRREPKTLNNQREATEHRSRPARELASLHDGREAELDGTGDDGLLESQDEANTLGAPERDTYPADKPKRGPAPRRRGTVGSRANEDPPDVSDADDLGDDLGHDTDDDYGQSEQD